MRMRTVFRFSSTLLSVRCRRWIKIQLILLLLRGQTQAIKVTGKDQVVLLGDRATLPCQLAATSDDINQVTWNRETEGNRDGKAFCVIQNTNGGSHNIIQDDRVKIAGSIKDNNGSITIANVTLMDRGKYTCIFTVYPGGNFQTEMILEVKVPPGTFVEDKFPVLSKSEALLATCTAFGSKPPAQVEWNLDNVPVTMRSTNESTLNDNGTTTTSSSLFGIPTIEMNKRVMKCIITWSALSEKKEIPYSLNVYFSPRNARITKVSENSFECEVDANPSANITWTRLGQPLPETVSREKIHILQFPSMTKNIDGIYNCEASNTYGTLVASLLVHVFPEPSNLCWTLFGLLLFLIILVELCLRCPAVRQRFSDVLSWFWITATSRQRSSELAQDEPAPHGVIEIAS